MHFKRISEILALEWNIQKYFCKAELKTVSNEFQTITSRRSTRQTRVQHAQPPPGVWQCLCTGCAERRGCVLGIFRGTKFETHF